MLVDEKAPYSAQVEKCMARAKLANKDLKVNDYFDKIKEMGEMRSLQDKQERNRQAAQNQRKADEMKAEIERLEELMKRPKKNASGQVVDVSILSLEQEKQLQMERAKSQYAPTLLERMKVLQRELNVRRQALEVFKQEEAYRKTKKQIGMAVNDMPPLCGDPPPSTLIERPLKKRIAEGLRNVNTDTKHYYRDVAEKKKELNESIVRYMKKSASDPGITVKELSKDFKRKEYSRMEDMFDRQDNVVQRRMDDNRRTYGEHLLTSNDLSKECNDYLSAMKKGSRAYLKEMESIRNQDGSEQLAFQDQMRKDDVPLIRSMARIQYRPSQDRRAEYGGYTPVVESKKRKSMNALLASLGDEASQTLAGSRRVGGGYSLPTELGMSNSLALERVRGAPAADSKAWTIGSAGLGAVASD